MTGIFKKASAVFLAVIMLFGTAPLMGAVFNADAAESGSCGENISWSLSDDGVLSISGNGAMNNYLISKQPWYAVRSEIKTVNVSEGVTVIGNNALYDCSNLTAVTLPSTLTVIGNNAFADCENLENITLPDSLSKIGDIAFYATGIRKIEIPASVTAIGENAFGWCDYLTEISVNENNAAFSSDENGVLYNKNKTQLIKYPCNSALTVFTVPDTVTDIEDYAFENCYKLRTVCIPENVAYVGYGAFFNSYLENIIVAPDNENYSNDGAGVLFDKNKTTLIQFPVNSEVTSYTIPETVTSVEDGAFHNNKSLENVVVSSGIKTLGDYVFLFCESLEYVHIPAETETIGEEIIDYTAAYICSDTDDCYAKEYADANGYNFVVCGEHSTGRQIIASGSCGDYTVWVLYDDGELVISGTGAMDNYDVDGAPWSEYADTIVKATVNDGVTNISDNAFNGCESLEKFEISDSVAYIGSCSFADCTGLKNIVIPASVVSINDDAFSGCTSIFSVRYLGSVDEWCAIQFGTAASNPASFAEEFYIKGTPVVDVVVSEGVECINGYAFANCETLTSVTLPDSVKTIGAGAFSGCTGLSEIILPENLEEICSEAFAGCTGFEYLHIPSYVTEIGDGAIDETIAYICSDAEESYAKTYANENNITFRLCQNHKVLGVSLPEAVEITNQSTYQLEAVINPENPTDKTVVWSSDNEKVVKVDKNGVATAVSVGEANVTVTTNDGGFTASCKVTVVPREFNITWIVNGIGTVQTVAEGTEIPVPEDPVKTGYTFAGWSTQIPEIMPSRNLLFSANWTANYYDAVFDANGGVWADGSTEKTVNSQFNTEIQIPEDPERMGYSFAGWNPVVGIMDNVNGKNFSAVWTAHGDTVYKVETYTMGTDGLYVLETGVFAGVTDSTVNAEYTIEQGFELNAEKSVLSGSIAADGSLVLKVYLDRIRNEVVINGETLEVIYGQLINEPSKPEVPEGHTQNGWADENGNAVGFPLAVGENMPAEINPVFVKLSYNVTWNVDGAETKETYEFEAEINKPADPVKYGYTFTGWTPEIPDSMPACDMTFIAVFDKNIYTCPDCGDKFDDEANYNEHIAYEQAKKAVRISIRNNPGTATIKYGETLKLTAITTSSIAGTKIFWYVDGEKQGEGETFSISFNSGTKTVTVKIVDENGNPLKDEAGNEISDEQKVSVNSSFWQKIVSFFKNLFRMNRTVTQSVLKNIF